MRLDNWPLFFLTQRPIVILAIALAVGGAAFWVRAHRMSAVALAVSAVLWLAYAAWELYMLQWRSPTGDMAIRVDAVYLEPIMQVVLVIDVVLAVIAWRH